MVGLTRLATEPPPEYVAFVARNLDMVRAEAARIVGDELAADRLYPEALTDVARRWDWLELRRRLLRRGVAEEYLCQALERRWQAGQAALAEAEPEPDPFMLDIRVLAPDEPPPRWPVAPSSAAVRLAPQLAPTARPAFGPVADAAIAWWHAYETRRRRRWIAVFVAALILAIAMVRYANNTRDNASLPAAPASCAHGSRVGSTDPRIRASIDGTPSTATEDCDDGGPVAGPDR